MEEDEYGVIVLKSGTMLKVTLEEVVIVRGKIFESSHGDVDWFTSVKYGYSVHLSSIEAVVKDPKAAIFTTNHIKSATDYRKDLWQSAYHSAMHEMAEYVKDPHNGFTGGDIDVLAKERADKALAAYDEEFTDKEEESSKAVDTLKEISEELKSMDKNIDNFRKSTKEYSDNSTKKFPLTFPDGDGIFDRGDEEKPNPDGVDIDNKDFSGTSGTTTDEEETTG